ncbi:hypothetical protein PL321_06085 [Caloramator sp. mosi_1]|uniref:hypothetical protein n=1 Tax=Caloramator sp. mosi_1 TaxID=3023090 RepID=UPI00235FCC14|nr:hypothetical protein [Caloramator sp. mosi_1]WDC85081.1 hypothetical protein PL321_06085 [Caloramator sp. mosi_1]
MYDKCCGAGCSNRAFLKTADKGRLAHSFIITGPDGVGKSIFARFMASYILCIGEKSLVVCV